MSYADVLDDAMYNKRRLRVQTEMRGEVVGVPYCVDEFDSDTERLGYCLQIAANEEDTVFLDEITSINVIPSLSIGAQREYAM